MFDDIAKKIERVRDFGNISDSVKDTCDKFEAELSKYDPLKVYSCYDYPGYHVEYRIQSTTDTDLMVGCAGTYINNIFREYTGITDALFKRGYQQLNIRRNGDYWWITFETRELD